jgi:ABC-type glycerol-3-phosphate transport system substrate-binding protein
MYLSSNLDVATLHQSMGSSVDWALFPPVDPAKTAQLDMFYDGMGIPKNAKNPSLAEKFLKFYMTPQAQALVLKAGINLPAVDDLPASADASDSLVNAMISDAAKNGTQLGWSSTVPASIGLGSINPLIEKMMLGQTTPGAIASQTQDALSTYRSGS